MKLPVLRQLNEAGGLALGVVKGLVLVCLGVWVLGRTGVLTEEMTEGTLLAGRIAAWTGAFGGGLLGERTAGERKDLPATENFQFVHANAAAFWYNGYKTMGPSGLAAMEVESYATDPVYKMQEAGGRGLHLED